jgi:cleavage and polyadenylation specificity factor subunit 3
VFATGRAQELLLILDEYWQQSPHLQHIPIFYASSIATKALRVYQTFINMMNNHIQKIADISNPFRFSHIRNFKGRDFDEFGPCVVMSSPGNDFYLCPLHAITVCKESSERV